MCEHSSKYSTEIEHFLHDQTGISAQDEEIGEVDGPDGWRALFRGGFFKGDTETWADDNDVDWTLEDVETLTDSAGFIVTEDNYGFVTVDVYDDSSALDYAWKSAVDANTLDACDECGQEAEYTGADQEVTHKLTCSEHPKLDFMGQQISPSKLMYDGKFLPYADGGYSLAYITKAGDVLCARCASDPHTVSDDPLVGADVEYDGESEFDITCDNCYAVIAKGSDDGDDD